MSASSSARITAKGAGYLSQLDQALCNSDWSKISELARKTEKHAAERRCFTLTARSQAQIASTPIRDTGNDSSRAFDELVPKLTEGRPAEEIYPEDAYAAKVCQAEIHWIQGDLDAALQALPKESLPTKSAGSPVVALGWLEVCEVKAEFIRIAALESKGQKDEARSLALSAAMRTPGSRTPELRRWTERLLARICMLMAQRNAQSSIQTLSQSLRCFTSWSDFWQRCASSNTKPDASNSRASIPRRRVWGAYYDLLSEILQHGLIYNPSPSSSSDLLMMPSDDVSYDYYTNAKSRQRTNMKKVEMNYESLLLQETQFPKANDTNAEVEQWVQRVITNWNIFNGPEWTDFELGDGGKEALSRVVLDILYRAATKTFHSTAILRHLFTVHAAIGEFDLAMHAFHSYVEIISKGKARAEKTGNHEIGFDTDDSAVSTAAEAIRILCRYGDREQGEKAREIAKTIEKWLSKERPSSAEAAKTHSDDNRARADAEPGQTTESTLQPKTLAAAYRAIGTAQAHWARLTFEADLRSAFQADAVKNFRLAQKYEEDSVATAYALALVLAETRHVSAAAQVLKHAIASSGSAEDSEDEGDDVEDNVRRRMLIPLWHLLALCLTAKDEYEQGVKMCEAAFEQFGDDHILFGDDGTTIGNEDEKGRLLWPRSGLVDLMDGFEKESILAIRITQLIFVELMEGAEPALDLSHELLSLYARLFGNPELYETTAQKSPPTAASPPPSRIGGTLRSIAGSIRPKSARHSVERNPRVESTMSLPAKGKSETDGATNGESVGVPISITVTNEDGVRTEKSHYHRHLAFMRRGFHSESNPSLRKKRSFRTDERPSTPIHRTQIPEHSVVNEEPPSTPTTVDQEMSLENPASPDQPLKAMEHNAPHDLWPRPPGHEEQPPRQDVRLPAPDPASNLVPDVRRPSARDRQQSIALLLKIWLFIAGLYLRAELPDDAASAINEASKLVESFEAEVGAEHSSARRFFEKGWGGGKSVDVLWADVWSAKGNLAVARDLPFEALGHFEQALAHFPDHPEAIIGISNLLMDIYEEKIPAEEPQPLLSSQPSPSSSSVSAGIPPLPQPPQDAESSAQANPKEADKPSATNNKRPTRDLTPAELNRLAARDRAYMLLSNLTRLGSGWDNSEAWFTLARAHELSKQINKAKQALWWVVELEENEPMRPWREVGAGGFTLSCGHE